MLWAAEEVVFSRPVRIRQVELVEQVGLVYTRSVRIQQVKECLKPNSTTTLFAADAVPIASPVAATACVPEPAFSHQTPGHWQLASW